jgi:hypothetical protein
MDFIDKSKGLYYFTVKINGKIELYQFVDYDEYLQIWYQYKQQGYIDEMFPLTYKYK